MLETYWMGTVTSGLCYIEDLNCLEIHINNIAWFCNSLGVQSTGNLVEYINIIYFHIRGFFLTAFWTSFRKQVDNSKEVVNLQSLLGLAVGYVDIKTYIH